ncbi:MAG: hypothetical protein K6F71_10580 [Ruminococcus sp.]|uniref:hypothetical protein n=1 Tax=Ruminococcus sp. TaxID=41978 RepID=UPI0025EF479E|nr:hypothetical protein [Ruminococcus sp.]MCR5541241.1 hypothetical protein [Ruminococcus sp.]
MKIEKIEDKSLNLDVQGQGCWSDCYVGGHWEEKANSKTNGCIWYNADYTSKSCIIW